MTVYDEINILTVYDFNTIYDLRLTTLQLLN